MTLNRATNTVANGSIFNDVGRDQVMFQLNIFFGSARSSRPSHQDHSPCSSKAPRTSIPESRYQATVFDIEYNSYDTISAADTATGLSIRIAKLFIDHHNSSNGHHCMKPVLKSLQQMLILAKLAIQQYDGKPLGQSLVNTVTPVVLQCCAILQELFGKIEGTQKGLGFTNICRLWPRVWWSQWDGDELASLRQKLSDSRKLLAGFLLGLHSVAWMDPVESHTGHFHHMFDQRLPSLGHVKMNAVQVLNHLGDVILVPDIFCSTWKDFHYIISCYCKDRPGDHFIQRGDFELMRDGQTVDPSELVTNAQSGVVLEMSVILRRTAAYQEECPRCGYMNSNAKSADNWIACCNCPGRFQVGRKANKQGDDIEMIDLCDGDEDEVMSPASGGNVDQIANSDGTQYFRLIRVICITVNSTQGNSKSESNGSTLSASKNQDSDERLFDSLPIFDTLSISSGSDPDEFDRPMICVDTSLLLQSNHYDSATLISGPPEISPGLLSPHSFMHETGPNSRYLRRHISAGNHQDPILKTGRSHQRNKSAPTSRHHRSYQHFDKNESNTRSISTPATQQACDTFYPGKNRSLILPSDSLGKQVAVERIRKAATSRRKYQHYDCEECDVTFTTNFAKDRHMRSHDGKKNFICTIRGCDQKFTTDSGRKRHEKSKTLHISL